MGQLTADVLGRRSLFPLSVLPAEPKPRGLARGCRQRVLRRQRRQCEVADAMMSLNWMSGCGQVGGGSCPVPGSVHDRVASLIDEQGPPIPEYCSDEAVRALLGSEVGYDDGDSSLATYQMGQVSLPASVASAPMAHDVGPGYCRDLLGGFEEHMLLSEDDFLEVADHTVPHKLHMDSVLEHNPTEYHAFIMDLHARGLLHWTRNPREMCNFSL